MVSIVYSQNNKNIDNLSAHNKELYKTLKAIEDQRKKNIAEFLNTNPTVKRFIYENGTLVKFLKDIVGGKPIYISQDNSEAAIATKTDRLMLGGSLNLNLDGSGVNVGVWEVNIPQENHVEFFDNSDTSSRVTLLDFINSDGSTNQSNHATHVIGTIAAKGVDPDAMGMAPNANVRSYNAVNDLSEMLIEASASGSPLLLSNHSYGVPPQDFQSNPWVIGAYTTDARNLDEIVKNNPYYLSVHSAGNSGNFDNPNPFFSGFDKLTLEKTSKNNLVIANADPAINGLGNLISFPINSSSSQGPTDDLRIKPDLAADGTNLYSSIPGNSYGTLSGTSMAAPNTTGTLALLQQYYNQLNSKFMFAATLKGLVCHTATDDSSIPGPDPIFGWGFLNAEFAANTITDASNGTAIIEETVLANGDSYTFSFNAISGDNIIASLCWTDTPGDIATSVDLNSDTPRLVNDLDIRIAKDGITYFPYYSDINIFSGFSNFKGDNSRDNLERIDFVAPSDGEYNVTISHKGTLVGFPIDDRRQEYSVIVTGNNLTLSTNDVSLSDKMTLYPNPTKDYFDLNFSISNDSDITVKIYDINARLVNEKIFSNYNNSIFKERFYTDNLTSGIYMVKVSNGNSIATKKLIIN